MLRSAEVLCRALSHQENQLCGGQYCSGAVFSQREWCASKRAYAQVASYLQKIDFILQKWMKPSKKLAKDSGSEDWRTAPQWLRHYPREFSFWPRKRLKWSLLTATVYSPGHNHGQFTSAGPVGVIIQVRKNYHLHY